MKETKPVKEVVFILDRSGSMSGLEDDTIGGFNSMLEKQRGLETCRAVVSTILFDDDLKVLHDRLPIDEIKPLTREDYYVGGCTALLDAMGAAIEHIKKIHKYSRDEDRPTQTLFIITTDGYENASRRYDLSTIKQLVEAQKESGWEFMFLGANIDAIGTAASMGINASRAANYHSDRKGTRAAYDALDGMMCCFFSAPMINFDDIDWKKVLDEDEEARKFLLGSDDQLR